MQLTIFGATGPLGMCLLKQALDAQHKVTILARTPSKIPDELKYAQGEILERGDQLKIVEGNVMNEDDCLKAVEGAEAVIVSLGGGGTDANVCSEGQKRINAAMDKCNADTRTVVVTSLGTGDSYDKCGFLTKLFVNTFLAGPIAAKNVQEESVRRCVPSCIIHVIDMWKLLLIPKAILILSGLKNWIIVRPGGLTNAEGNGTWNASPDISGGSIPRADVAAFILAECLAGDSKWRNKATSIVS